MAEKEKVMGTEWMSTNLRFLRCARLEISYEVDDWGGMDQSKTSEWGTYQGLWIGQMTSKKKRQSFCSTKEFDEVIHKSKSWRGADASRSEVQCGVPRATIIGGEFDKHYNPFEIEKVDEVAKDCRKFKAYHGAPCATIDKPRSFAHFNKFDILEKEVKEELEAGDQCGGCNVGFTEFERGCGCHEQMQRKKATKKLQILQRMATLSKTVAACGEPKKKWKCLSVAVDSGACDNVIDPKDVGEYEEFVKDTEASLNHENFLAANGEEIPNFGEVKVPVITREKTLRGITFQAAGVAKGLLSVEKMNETGHVVQRDCLVSRR